MIQRACYAFKFAANTVTLRDFHIRFQIRDFLLLQVNAISFLMASPNTLKRNFHEVEIHSPLIHQSDRLETHGIVSPTPENWNQTSAQISSAEISTDKPSAHDGSSFADGVRVLHPTPSALPAKTSNKRKKLTHAEQEAKQMEKAAKDRQKAEEKEFKDRQRAEEKGKLEESRRAKEAEKEERRKAKEARTRMKEEERQKKEEEKNKKEKVITRNSVV